MVRYTRSDMKLMHYGPRVSVWRHLPTDRMIVLTKVKFEDDQFMVGEHECDFSEASSADMHGFEVLMRSSKNE